jgi:predicted nucleic acid-binding protein
MKNIKTLVLDASVLLQPVLGQDTTDKVRRILYAKNDFEYSILVPEIFRYEYYNIITRRFDAEAAERAFNEMTELQFSIIPLESDLVDGANRLMRKYPKISFYDAAYHALAKAYRVPLVTADERYFALTRREGDVKLLEELKV